VRGISIAGIGVGGGEGVTGVSVAGFGVGGGGKVSGLSVAGIGVGAPSVSGIVITGVGAGTVDFNGGALAPLYFRIEKEGSMRGVSLSAFNRVSGVQMDSRSACSTSRKSSAVCRSDSSTLRAAIQAAGACYRS
jgi:hypothetical protein